MLREGDVIELNESHSVYADVPERYVYANRKDSKAMTHTKVNLNDFRYNHFISRYIVTKTVMDGGGTGHGPHNIYPDGHHVFCVSEDGKYNVDFYQSGAFTAMIGDIEPVGRAELTWEIVE